MSEDPTKCPKVSQWLFFLNISELSRTFLVSLKNKFTLRMSQMNICLVSVEKRRFIFLLKYVVVIKLHKVSICCVVLSTKFVSCSSIFVPMTCDMINSDLKTHSHSIMSLIDFPLSEHVMSSILFLTKSLQKFLFYFSTRDWWFDSNVPCFS